MQKDRWYCHTCGNIFYEPEGYERYSHKPSFRLSCGYCHGYNTVNGEMYLKSYLKRLRSSNTLISQNAQSIADVLLDKSKHVT